MNQDENVKAKKEKHSSLRQAPASHAAEQKSNSGKNPGGSSSAKTDDAKQPNKQKSSLRQAPASHVGIEEQEQVENEVIQVVQEDIDEDRLPGAFREGGRSGDDDTDEDENPRHDDTAQARDPNPALLENSVVDIEAPTANAVDKNELVEELREEIIGQYLQQATTHATAVEQVTDDEQKHRNEEGTKRRRKSILLITLLLVILIAVGVGVGVAVSSSSGGSDGSSKELETETDTGRTDDVEEDPTTDPPTGMRSGDDDNEDPGGDQSSPTSCLSEESCVSGDQVCRFSTNLCTSFGSCAGDRGCLGTTNLTVGQNSCIGHSACNNVAGTTVSISSDSCVGIGACRNFAGKSIGSNSCNCPGCCDCYPSGTLPDDIPSDSCNFIGDCCSSVGLAAVATSLSTASTLQDIESPQYLAVSSVLEDSLNFEGADWSSGYGLLQRYVLYIFFYSTGGETWSRGPPPTWFSTVFEEVTTFDFADENLIGTLPIELGALTALTMISLDNNLLSSSMPTELGQLALLESLVLSRNSLSGHVPSELGILEELEDLDLKFNQISGTIPTELGRSARLRKLVLNDNELSGALPSELGGLTDLTALEVHDNQLTGSIPAELGNAKSLWWLDLSLNLFSGTFPSELSQLTALINLRIQDNNISGAVPVAFCSEPFPDWSTALLAFIWADCLDEDDRLSCECCTRCYGLAPTSQFLIPAYRECYDDDGAYTC